MDFTKLNKGFKKIEWGIDTKNYPFKKLKDYEDGTVLKVKGFFLTKDIFNGGFNPIMIVDGALVNCPKHLEEVVETILDDNGFIEAIKNGECMVKVKHFKGKKGAALGKDCATFDFIAS